MSSTYESPERKTLDPLGIGVESDDIEPGLHGAHGER